MKGRIEGIEEKQAKNGRTYLLLSIGGQNCSLWDGKLFDNVKEGDMVDYKWKQSGEYRNITEIAPADEPSGNGQPVREVQILKMSCLKSASAILANLGCEPDERVAFTIEAARKFEKYVTGNDDEDYPATRPSHRPPGSHSPARTPAPRRG